jgi:hypothetical protein
VRPTDGSVNGVIDPEPVDPIDGDRIEVLGKG